MYSRFSQALGLALITFAPVISANSQEVAPDDANQPIRPESGRMLVNKMAATVNGDVITLNELMIKVAPLQSVLMSRSPRRGPAYEAQLAQLKSSILDELIDRAIIFTEFKDRVKAFPDQQIEDEVKRIVQNVYKGDEELLKDYLKATNLTRDQFKEQQRKELLVQIVRAQHFGDVAVPKEAELLEEYRKWSITNRDRTKDVGTYRRIYLAKNRGSGVQGQLNLAEQLVERLKGGSDFAELAKTHSNDSRAGEGGLWEDIARTDRNIEFGYILFESEGKEVLGPFEDRVGFNIIQVVERKFGEAEPFAKVRDEMEQRVVSEKKKGNFEKWMKKMRSRAVIKKML